MSRIGRVFAALRDSPTIAQAQNALDHSRIPRSAHVASNSVGTVEMTSPCWAQHVVSAAQNANLKVLCSFFECCHCDQALFIIECVLEQKWAIEYTALVVVWRLLWDLTSVWTTFSLEQWKQCSQLMAKFEALSQNKINGDAMSCLAHHLMRNCHLRRHGGLTTGGSFFVPNASSATSNVVRLAKLEIALLQASCSREETDLIRDMSVIRVCTCEAREAFTPEFLVWCTRKCDDVNVGLFASVCCFFTDTAALLPVLLNEQAHESSPVDRSRLLSSWHLTREELKEIPHAPSSECGRAIESSASWLFHDTDTDADTDTALFCQHSSQSLNSLSNTDTFSKVQRKCSLRGVRFLSNFGPPVLRLILCNANVALRCHFLLEAMTNLERCVEEFVDRVCHRLNLLQNDDCEGDQIGGISLYTLRFFCDPL